MGVRVRGAETCPSGSLRHRETRETRASRDILETPLSRVPAPSRLAAHAMAGERKVGGIFGRGTRFNTAT